MRIRSRCWLTVLAAATAAAIIAAPEYVERDINPLYIKSMPGKPWWNAQYRFRMPVLVSDTIGKPRTRATVDVICDLGQAFASGEIRVVTPWEEEIPSQVMPAGSNCVEIVFQTDLRSYEQKPFFIYFGNPGAPAPEYRTDLIMHDGATNLLEIRNEKIQAQFTLNDTRPGKVRRLRIIGSPVQNQLTEMGVGASWAGLELGKNPVAPKPAIKTDGPLKKTLEYTGEGFSVEYTVYSFSPRIDFRIIPQGAKTLNTVTKWTAGGGDAYDMFHYEGLKGPMQFKAAPDKISDKAGMAPDEILTKYLREGWAAVSDEQVGETTGNFFDRGAMTAFRYFGHALNGGEIFFVNFKLDKPVHGALVAMRGDWNEFRGHYIDWKNPPAVSQGAVQSFTNIACQIPDYTRDFIRGWHFAANRSQERVTPDFAEQLIYNVRKLSGNSVKLVMNNIMDAPISRELYAAYTNLPTNYYSASWPLRYGDYDAAMAGGSYLSRLIDAAHAKGVAVRSWNFFYPIARSADDYIRNDQLADFVVAYYKELAGSGIDLLQFYITSEWSFVPPETGMKVSDPFWEKNPDAWFKLEADIIRLWKRVYAAVKQVNPDLPVNTLASSSGLLQKMDFIDLKAQYLDTVENEFVPGMIPRMPSLKYGIKRMQGAFGNDGRTIQHHFYFFEPNPLWRVSEMETPLIFGIKSFSCESINHYIKNPELNEITADFYRLMDYTALEKFIAGTTPCKHVALFRDGQAVEDDIRNNRVSYAFSGARSEHESRCMQFAVLKNLPLDVLFNQYFNADEMQKYRLVFVPSDRVLRDEYVSEIEKYVNAGGIVVSEGETAMNAKFARLAGIRKTGDGPVKADLAGVPARAPFGVVADGAEILVSDESGEPAVYQQRHGAGKVIYSPFILSDEINNSIEKEMFVRGLVTQAAGAGPIIPAADMAGKFESALLANGNAYFYGVYNPSVDKPLRTAIKLELPGLTADAWLLDVKTGRREKFEGVARTDIAPLQTAFYLIGSEASTAAPALRPAVWAGASAGEQGMEFVDVPEHVFEFEFTPPGKPKKVGVLRIHDKRGRQGQAWGAEAIHDCLKTNLPDIRVAYLENLQYETINGCDAVIVPNMGPSMPYQLRDKWWIRLREFAEQGGGAMVMHHAMGVGQLGEPPFPGVGKWSGNYYAVHDFKVTAEHPATAGLKIGDVFHDQCWDYDEVAPGDDAIVLARGLRAGVPTPALVAGQCGQGKVVVSGIGIGAGYKKEDGKSVKYEAAPEGGLQTILLNSVRWILP